jgi:excisionase family DNA binding protein
VFYTPAEVGALVGVGADTVRDWLAAGRLDAVPLGEPKGRQGVRWRVPRAGLAAFLRGRKRTA